MAEYRQVLRGGRADEPHLLGQPRVAIVDAHSTAEEHAARDIVEVLRYRFVAIDRHEFPGNAAGIEVIGDAPGWIQRL